MDRGHTILLYNAKLGRMMSLERGEVSVRLKGYRFWMIRI
jgi:hypothetical protein